MVATFDSEVSSATVLEYRFWFQNRMHLSASVVSGRESLSVVPGVPQHHCCTTLSRHRVHDQVVQHVCLLRVASHRSNERVLPRRDLFDRSLAVVGHKVHMWSHERFVRVLRDPEDASDCCPVELTGSFVE